MPLMDGDSDDAVSYNISELRHSGHPENQAIAIAMNKKRQAKKRKSGMKTMKPTRPGQKPITFHEGGLHASTGTKPGAKIPASKHAAAASGKLGPKAKKQENFYRNVLKH